MAMLEGEGALVFPGANTNPACVAMVAGEFGLAVLDTQGIREARALAARLISNAIAPDEDFVLVQSIFPAAVFGHREDEALTGVLAAFPLNEAGARALAEGCFDAARLDAGLVAHAGQSPAAYYGWGFAATTRDGARAVMKASLEIHRRLYFSTPTFARAVTADGRRALQSIGFRLLPGSADLFTIAPTIGAEQTAGAGR